MTTIDAYLEILGRKKKSSEFFGNKKKKAKW